MREEQSRPKKVQWYGAALVLAAKGDLSALKTHGSTCDERDLR